MLYKPGVQFTKGPAQGQHKQQWEGKGECRGSSASAERPIVFVGLRAAPVEQPHPAWGSLRAALRDNRPRDHISQGGHSEQGVGQRVSSTLQTTHVRGPNNVTTAAGGLQGNGLGSCAQQAPATPQCCRDLPASQWCAQQRAPPAAHSAPPELGTVWRSNWASCRRCENDKADTNACSCRCWLPGPWLVPRLVRWGMEGAAQRRPGRASPLRWTTQTTQRVAHLTTSSEGSWLLDRLFSHSGVSSLVSQLPRSATTKITRRNRMRGMTRKRWRGPFEEWKVCSLIFLSGHHRTGLGDVQGTPSAVPVDDKPGMAGLAVAFASFLASDPPQIT